MTHTDSKSASTVVFTAYGSTVTEIFILFSGPADENGACDDLVKHQLTLLNHTHDLRSHSRGVGSDNQSSLHTDGRSGSSEGLSSDVVFISRSSSVFPALERKMSVRQSREELIKRGVLKEIFEKGCYQ